MKRILTLALVVCAVLPGMANAQNAALMPAPKMQFLDNAGAPLSGGFLYTCVVGSACTPAIAGDPALNPLATYTDSTAAVPNANPVVLDSAGRANVWLGAGTYKLVLQDQYGAAVWTQDNVAATSMKAIQTTTGAVSNFNVPGALTAGSINSVVMCDQQAGSDAAAKIQACVNALPSTGGIADARGIQGAQSWGSTVTISRNGEKLLLGAAQFSGAANPMLSISGQGDTVEGILGNTYNSPPTAGTQFQPTSTNGAIYAGFPSTSNASAVLGLTLRNLSVYAPTGSAPSYGVYLQNVSFFELDGIAVNGHSLMTTGYLLEGAEQGEIHGGAILLNSKTNVDWRVFNFGGTSRQASANGVEFHGMTLQTSFASGTNMLFEKNCCDDAEIVDNHFVISLGALMNIDVEGTDLSWSSGPYVIAHNHIESFSSAPYAITNPTSSWPVLIKNAVNVVLKGNAISPAGAPYNVVWITGTSNGNRIVDGNTLAGQITIDSTVRDTLFASNFAGGVASVTDAGIDTVWQENRTINVADTFVASGYSGTDIEQFKPKHATDGSISGTHWGVTVRGKTGFDTYLRLSPSTGTDSVTLSETNSGTGTLCVHAAPGDPCWFYTNSGGFNLLSGVTLQYQTDGGGNIGQVTSNRPNLIYVKTGLNVANGNWAVGSDGNVNMGKAGFKALTGTRFVCVDTSGNLVSQTSACSGT